MAAITVAASSTHSSTAACILHRLYALDVRNLETVVFVLAHIEVAILGADIDEHQVDVVLLQLVEHRVGHLTRTI